MTTSPLMPPSDLDSWRTVAPGLEFRIYLPEGQPTGLIAALRIDPTQYAFRVHYRPGDPQYMGQWREQLQGAAAFINTNFFDPEFRALGLVVADGVVHGNAFTSRGGLFAIQDNLPLIRSNVHEPYAGEPYAQAVQGFPMLILDGQVNFTDTTGDRNTRRTAIGIDSQGRVVLLATPGLGLRLAEFAAFLAETDLGLTQAFNLDGGGSTMMVVPSADFILPSLDSVPTVLAVYPINQR